MSGSAHFVLASAIAAALVACKPTPDAELGRLQFEKYCIGCHATEGRPAPGAPDLTRLAQKYGSPLPRDVLAAWIDGRRGSEAHGPREMPVWGERLYQTFPATPGTESVRAGTIDVILDYLESIQRTD
jgi:mono/diheme cytochrome c family protein